MDEKLEVEHLLVQAASGEFALLKEEAAISSPEDFAHKYQQSIRETSYYKIVNVDGCDYYWSKNGKYDGWGTNLQQTENPL